MQKRTLFIIFVSLAFIGCSTLFKSYKSEIDGIYIPKNLDDALVEVDKFYSDSLKTEISKLDENQYSGLYHFGTGLWIRNNWGLWGGSRLARFFVRKGLKHPDDMSGIILVSYHRKLTGKPIDFKGQLAKYEQYWKESRKFAELTKLPKPKDQPEENLAFGYVKSYQNNDKTSLIHFQTNSESDSVWIYDYLYGWEKIEKQTAENLKNHQKYKTDSILKLVFKR